MSAIDCARAILRYVSDTDTAITLVAIAGAESGWNLGAAGDYYNSGKCPQNWCRGYCSWGPWQINICCHSSWIGDQIGSHDPCVVAQWLTSDWNNSAWAAWKILTEHGGLYAWSVYNNGSYRAYLAEARAAVEQALREGIQPPTPPGRSEVFIPGGGEVPSPLYVLIPVTATLVGLSGAVLILLWHKGISIPEAKNMLLRRLSSWRLIGLT